MLFRNFLLIIMAALSAAAADSPSGAEMLRRIQKLGDDCDTFNTLMGKLGGDNGTSTDIHVQLQEIMKAYNQTIQDETRDLNSSQPTAPYAKDVQLKICDAYHLAFEKRVKSEKFLAEKADKFEKDMNLILRDSQETFRWQLKRFNNLIAPKAVPDCVEKVKEWNKDLDRAIDAALRALEDADQE